MGRGKVQLKKIDNKINRQVTFCKRRNGLMKKAHELSVLCEAEVALIILSPRGKIYEYASGRMERTTEKYNEFSALKIQHDKPFVDPNYKNIHDWHDEVTKLRQQSVCLVHSIRQLTGEGISSLSLGDLQQLEDKLQKSIGCIRSRKDESLLEEIADRRRKIYMLEANNQFLLNKIGKDRSHTCRMDLNQGLEYSSPQELQEMVSYEAHRNSNSTSDVTETTLQLG